MRGNTSIKEKNFGVSLKSYSSKPTHAGKPTGIKIPYIYSILETDIGLYIFSESTVSYFSNLNLPKKTEVSSFSSLKKENP